ncbi:MAG: hypothetical protein ACRCXT_01840 [Paraclostridium sp.]
MNDANISEDIKQERQFNIKIIITISICIYIGYIIRIPFFNIVHSVDMNDFSIVLNLALSVLGIASCLSSYNSNKKEEVFIMALMYTMFFIDILNSKETGYLLDKKQIEYYAILTSLVRVCIVYVAVSNLKKLKNFIINNKLECMIMISAISYLLLYIEYNMMTPYSKNILIFYKYYNIFLAILYTIISIRFFKKSLVKKDYIYGVIGASALIFSIKSIYDFYYTINSSKEIEIMANSTILLGFITFIIGLFIELSQTIKINRVLDE